ncbi:MAG TPA: low molecular weight phosphotyrosine protein phosphatase [Candidatus Avisuccinivibrio pullicola]|nr:low molecular weight phosphotyrosine protein phosphatase [Candidatus Avisuccinivibrio pullicola]
MTRVLFLCHGNICRSPMAEYMLKKIITERHLEDRLSVASAAVSEEETGNGVYPPARRVLNRMGIDCRAHRARRVSAQDFKDYDLIIAMDRSNLRWLDYIEGTDKSRVRLLMSFTGSDADVADPWYTGDFETTRRDISAGLEGILKELEVTGRI